MRIDHHAYQRATKVAGFGLLLQLVIGVVLLVFGMSSGDTAFQFAALYILTGVLAWLGLVIIFHQHKLERLEALEEDELASTRRAGVGAGSVFEREGDASRVAARRLAIMHRWLMPALSLLIALILAGLAWRYIWYMRFADFHVAEARGWAVAICLSVAALCFIFSRFIAGMAKQPAWQNLRGGAAYMVGNALVMVAVAVGIIFLFFENEAVLKAVAWAIPFFLALLSLEIGVNFILNLYRPRIPGEVPRPAFDSKILSLFATPDSIVRSLNEAVNYQFGFDVTSSWGYQLLLRSFVWLMILGVAALVLLSTMVVIEPHQQAVKLRGGAIVGDKVYTSGVMWKLPWPLETAQVHDVTKVRSLHLTPRVIKDRHVPVEQRVITWSESESPTTDATIEPFVVGSSMLTAHLPEPPAAETLQAAEPADLESDAQAQEDPEAAREEAATQRVSSSYSLVDAEIVLQYRVRAEQGRLLDYLRFAPETVARRQTLSDRERALKALALGEISEHLARLSLDHVLSPGRSNLAADLQRKIQAAFDAQSTGVEVVAIDLPMLRPSDGSAPTFEELGISHQARREAEAVAQADALKGFTLLLGNAELRQKVIAGIDEYNRLAAELGPDHEQTITQRQAVEEDLVKGDGGVAESLAQAEASRWYDLMRARSEASRVQGELAAYVAAPELYQQRELMKLYKQYLPLAHKYIIAIDPARVNLDMDLKDVNPILSFPGASEEEMKQE